MIQSIRLQLRSFVIRIAQLLGSDLMDYRNGKKIGRALLIPWRGKIIVVGLQAVVRPVFLPTNSIHYWKQEISFTLHDTPDFPRE